MNEKWNNKEEKNFLLILLNIIKSNSIQIKNSILKLILILNDLNNYKIIITSIIIIFLMSIEQNEIIVA